MVQRLRKRSVVFVGGGLTAGLAVRQMMGSGIDVLVLERGSDLAGSAAATLPNQRDELRWGVRNSLIQNWANETYTLRHRVKEEAFPIRRMEAFLPGEGLGGAANHWNGQTWRWAEYDPVLRTRLESRYGKAAIPAELTVQDWGINYAEMEPYHDLFERLFGIAGQAGNIGGKLVEGGNPFEAPRKGDFPQQPLEILESGSIFKAAAQSLGYKPFPLPAANSPRAYTNPDGVSLGQCQYCGHCERFICEANAKASPMVVLYPMLQKHRDFEVRLHSQVTELVYDERAKRVTAVRFIDLETAQEYEQPADVVVLSGFTMTNTKLLLVSGIGRPYDPKTGKGMVGKNFCYQVMSAVPVFFRDRWINPFMASGASQMVVDEFNGDNFDHAGLGFFGGGYIYSNVTNGRPITSRLLPPGTPRWGSAWKQANADWYAHAFNVSVHGSNYPHRENYLDLDPTYRDAYGMPLVRMTFNFHDNDYRMSEYVTNKAVEIARSMGATTVGTPQPRRGDFDSRQYQTTHTTGGTIMGADPASSVVSPRLQHWDAQNLFVVGASVYPHNAGYNPTGPLAALALRLGDDLVRYAKQQKML
ncbi:GMC family oxidoreductase [Variovorax sp. OV329]|uniref:GMC family oxidoreductase n=1 Tax=Variovorax sp. OV329 TaxID=1882825 RepID=UPI0008E824B3|nr:GMC family oxidoreductase [Variovorax sp. OV329]SFN50287.1 gluconate 2-dehydrogenase alpha chain [Variovorax sp. OV329]